MAEDQGEKEEQKFEFDSAGEAVGYITLEQARVLAIRHARDNTDFYGPAYSGVNLVSEVVSQEEGEEYYDIRLSFRPAGRFRGEPGVEQFIIDKTGDIQVRQILDEPSTLGRSARRRPPVLLLSAVGAVVVAVVAVAAIFASGIFAGGGPPPTATPIPTIAPTLPTPTPIVIEKEVIKEVPVTVEKEVPVVVVATPTPTATPRATATPVPTATPTPTATPLLTPTSPPTPTPIPTQLPAPTGPPQITLSPSTAVANQQITVAATGFTRGGTVASITVGGINVPTLSGGAVVTTAKMDNSGNMIATFRVPNNQVTRTAGTQLIRVTGSGTRIGDATLTTPEQVLTLATNEIRRASLVNFTGSGFLAEGTVTISYRTLANTVTTVTASAGGNISGSFTVPSTAANAPIPSTNAVTATISCTAGTPPGNVCAQTSASATHRVPGASIAFTPSSATPGETIIVSGKGFPGFSVVAALSISGIDTRPAPVPATNADGEFTTSILVPQLALGTHAVLVTVGGTNASAAFTVVEAAGDGSYLIVVERPAGFGRSVTFQVGNYEAGQTGTWRQGQVEVLNLATSRANQAIIPKLAVQPSSGPQIPPQVFVGTATIDGLPAPTGTVITAWVDGQPVAQGTVTPRTPLSSSQSAQMASDLEPLGNNLLTLWFFDNSNQSWRFYDPRESLAGFNTLGQLDQGRVYFFNMSQNQTATLNSRQWTLFAGFNLTAW